MKLKEYKSYVLIGVLFFALCLGIILINSQTHILSILSRGEMMKKIKRDIIESTIPQPQQGIPVSIQDIISERYLYTLTRSIEKELGLKIHASIEIQSNYSTFDRVSRDNNNYIFTLHGTTISFPVSSYFFDKVNNSSMQVNSGEAILSGTIDQKSKKVIALTFDDGPSQKYTHILLDILKNENIHATFYVLGSRVDEYPDILKREYREGHEIGNHSYSHALLTTLSERMMQEELYKTDQAIYTTIGIYPTTFRPPYGGVNTGILEKAAMPAILWSIDPHDWKTHNIAKNIAAIAHAKNGDILIMHDIHEASVASVPTIIKKLRDQGFTFVTISELLSLSENNTEIGKKCTKQGDCK